MYRIYSKLAVVSAAVFLAAGTVAAQGPDSTVQLDIVHQQYELALVSGDVDGVMAVFAEDAAYLPFVGGTFEGTAAIRSFVEAAPRMDSFDIRGGSVETFGDVVVDIGTFTAERAGTTLEGEYVAILVPTEQGLKVQKLIGFPARAAD